MLEAPILQLSRLAASELGYRVFRNNRGLFLTMDGRKVRAGLEAEGSSDLIGFVPLEITEEMVGKTVAVFLAVETKKSSWKKPTTKTEKKQQNFIDFVRGFGGIAFFLNDAKKMKKNVDDVLEKWLSNV